MKLEQSALCGVTYVLHRLTRGCVQEFDDGQLDLAALVRVSDQHHVFRAMAKNAALEHHRLGTNLRRHELPFGAARQKSLSRRSPLPIEVVFRVVAVCGTSPRPLHADLSHLGSFRSALLSVLLRLPRELRRQRIIRPLRVPEDRNDPPALAVVQKLK